MDLVAGNHLWKHALENCMFIDRFLQGGPGWPQTCDPFLLASQTLALHTWDTSHYHFIIYLITIIILTGIM